MDQIIFIQYIDTFYFEENKLVSDKFITHYSVGKLITASKKSVVISFTEKDGMPWRGLVLPRKAIIFDEKNNMSEPARVKNKIKKMKKGTTVGIFWKDIVYFENGVVPSSPSSMYTEGKIFSVTANAIIIKNPETMNITRGKLTDHPKELIYISFMIVPRLLVTDIEIYDK